MTRMTAALVLPMSVSTAPGWVPGGIHLGAFLTVLISFVIVAAAVYFMVVVPMNAIAARRAAGEEAPAAPSEEVTLLTEIRDALNRR